MRRSVNIVMVNKMKKQYLQYLISWISLIAFLFLFAVVTSCGSRTIIAKEKEHTTDNTRVNRKRLDAVFVSNEVTDTVTIALPPVTTTKPECDSICQDVVDYYMGLISQQKRSGDNQYSILYDKYTRQLEINVKLGETLDHLKHERNDSIVYKENKIYKERPVAYVPKFWRYSAYAGWLYSFFLLLRITLKLRSWVRKKFYLE